MRSLIKFQEKLVRVSGLDPSILMRGLAREFDEIGRVDASTEKRVVGNKEISGPYICPLLDEMLWQRMLQRRYKFWAGQEQIAS